MTKMTKMELIVTSDEAGYKWATRDLAVAVDLSAPDAAQKIGELVLAKIAWTEAWLDGQTPSEPSYEELEARRLRIETNGHDCFEASNEVIHIDGDEAWTTCRVCGKTISAG